MCVFSSNGFGPCTSAQREHQSLTDSIGTLAPLLYTNKMCVFSLCSAAAAAATEAVAAVTAAAQRYNNAI